MPNPNPIVAGPALHPGWMKKIAASELAIQQLSARIAALEKEVMVLKLTPVKVSPVPPSPIVYTPNAIASLPGEQPKRGPGRPRKNPIDG